MLEAKTDNSQNESSFMNEKLKANNRNNPALEGKRSRTRQSHAATRWLGSLKKESRPRKLRDRFIKPLNTVQVMVAHVASSESKLELDSHTFMCVVVTTV